MGSENRGDNHRNSFIRVYGTALPVPVSIRQGNTDVNVPCGIVNSALIQLRDGETLSDAMDRGVIKILDRLGVNQLYNVWSEPVSMSDAMSELIRDR